MLLQNNTPQTYPYYDNKHYYYCLTITLPENKYITFLHNTNTKWKDFTIEDKKLYLSFLFDCLISQFSTVPSSLQYEAYERHPKRGYDNYHLHGIIDTLTPVNIPQVHSLLFKLTDCKIIKSITHISLLETEIDLVNWFNYMHKDKENFLMMFSRAMEKELHNI